MGWLIGLSRKRVKQGYNMQLTASELLATLDPQTNLTPDDVSIFCVACADKMRRRGYRSIKASVLQASLKEAEGWETLPKGWTQKSLKSYWDSLTGSNVHKVTKCIKKMQGHVDDPGAFCGSLGRRLS